MAADDPGRADRVAPVSGLPAEGEDLSRIKGVSDGVFAFAMTLLVIYLTVPTQAALTAAAPHAGSANEQLLQYLYQARTTFFAYGLAFFVAANWWAAHHRIFRILGRYDDVLVTINFVFLALIAITPFEAGLLGAWGTEPVTIIVYAGTQALIGAVLALLNTYLLGRGRHLLYPGVYAGTVEYRRTASLISVLGFVVSIPIGFVSAYAAYTVWVLILAVRFLRGRPPSPPGAGVR